MLKTLSLNTCPFDPLHAYVWTQTYTFKHILWRSYETRHRGSFLCADLTKDKILSFIPITTGILGHYYQELNYPL